MTSPGLRFARFLPSLTCLLVAVFTVSAAAQTAEPASATRATGSIWTRLKTPNIGAADVLLSLSADSPADVWSVGNFVSLQFNGSTWTAIPLVTIQTQGSSEATMNGIAALSPTNVWAVGTTVEQTSSGAHLIPMIENYNGSAWSIVTSPAFPNGAELLAIQAISSTDIYAVGDSNADVQLPVPLVEHYDGTAWSVVTLPAANGSLRSLAALSDSDIWVVGDNGTVTPTSTLAMNFNGTQWNTVSVPLPANGKVHDLRFGSGITAISSNDIWAVGDFTPSSTLITSTLTEHWNGTAWKIVPSPNIVSANSTRLSGVAAVSTGDVWACGQSLGSSGFANVIEHWNGTRWTISPVAKGSGFAGLNAMLALSSSSVYAAGSDFANGNLVSVIFHTAQGN